MLTSLDVVLVSMQKQMLFNLSMQDVLAANYVSKQLLCYPAAGLRHTRNLVLCTR